MKDRYVQYGCGKSAPTDWINFDVSPTLRIQKIPLFGKLFKSKLNTIFPDNVKYGDIIKGLPIEDDSCKGVYCSHTLEHLSLKDFRTALKNTYKIIQKGGLFRCIVPDLEWAIHNYLREVEQGNTDASINFMNNTLLGKKNRPNGVRSVLSSSIGNSAHLWMWDARSLSSELEKVGFTNIRMCKFGDSNNEMFSLVEDESRFVNAAAIECCK